MKLFFCFYLMILSLRKIGLGGIMSGPIIYSHALLKSHSIAIGSANLTKVPHLIRKNETRRRLSNCEMIRLIIWKNIQLVWLA